jgi:hypothetical protein
MESLFFIFTCGEQDIFLQDKYPPKNISNISNNTFNYSNNLNNNLNNNLKK